MANQFQKAVIDNVDRDQLDAWYKQLVETQEKMATMLSEVKGIDDNIARILLTNKIDMVAIYVGEAADDIEAILDEYTPSEKED